MQQHPVISTTFMKHIGLELQHRNLLEVYTYGFFTTNMWLLNWGEEDMDINEVWLQLLWFSLMPTWINHWQRWRESTNISRLECPLQLYSYMVRGHEIEKVPVVGVEGHDVVDWFAGWQLQCPLISHGHVRQEGQLWKRHKGGDREEDACWITVSEQVQNGAINIFPQRKFSFTNCLLHIHTEEPLKYWELLNVTAVYQEHS